MLLDIRKLFSAPESAHPLQFAFDFSEEDFPGYQVGQPCEGTLEIGWEAHGRRLRLKLSAQVCVDTECARCLAPVQAMLPLARTVLLRAEDWQQSEEDLPLTEDGKLDVRELVYTEILVTVPSTFLCDENCKGLCPVCGKARALGCTCEEMSQRTDPVTENQLSIQLHLR